MTNTQRIDGSDAALLARIENYFSISEQRAMRTLALRLISQAGGLDHLSGFRVMVAYGGGKDSSYTLAFMRAVQLQLAVDVGQTFMLRVASMRHAGVTAAVMANIDRVYWALALYHDPRVQLVVVDHEQVRPFERELEFPAAVRAMNRLDVLMNGHRAAGDGRPTFCNSCNLAVADFYGRAAWWRGGVNVIVTGDSRKEQKHYFAWVMRLAERLGLDVASSRQQGFRGLLQALDGVSGRYFAELFGPGFEQECEQRRVSCGAAAGDAAADPEFISIYDLVSYCAQDHWSLLTEFLGFRFDELAFSFTESDCANPMLMAHMRGLKAEHVQGRTYHDGISDYLELALRLMQKKEMPERLISLALAPYATPDLIAVRRELAARFASEAFDLDEVQLVCMQFSPFVDAGQALADYVAHCHAHRLPDLPGLHQVLSGQAEDASLATWLSQVSGLSLKALRSLYANVRIDFDQDSSIVSWVRAGDPHKGRLTRIDPHTGQVLVEVVSGR